MILIDVRNKQVKWFNTTLPLKCPHGRYTLKIQFPFSGLWYYVLCFIYMLIDLICMQKFLEVNLFVLLT